MTDFKDTLNLPRTDFPIRPNAAVDDVALINRWKEHRLYANATEKNKGNEKYILHDGPPYANGNIHLGHAYNKILKDIITKARRMSGYHVPVIPGWDCHGLPIELKVTQSGSYTSPIEIKKACRAYAAQWIDVQREEFKRLGVIMDWDNPYITMAPSYEASIVRAFGHLHERGFIERKNKTVAWCFSCQTTLASAEIEYKDRKDPSLYVLFPVDKESIVRQFPSLALTVGDREVSIIVWTTTPWTLPLNRAVMMHPHAFYTLFEMNGQLFLVGSELVEKVGSLVEGEKKVIARYSAEELKNLRLRHPFVEGLTIPFILDENVGTTDGTAFVHTAPGCGPIDYEVGVKNNLEIFSPITADGKYDVGIEPRELEGMSVVDGQIWVIKKLAALNRLFYKSSLHHSYPHCWRCHNGLIFRATPQWFIDLKHDHLQEHACEITEKIDFIPVSGRNFLRATVEHRWEWCLSRQRVWGAPIPALLCVSCDAVYITAELIKKVVDGIAQEGIEYWDRVSLEELAQGIICACGSTHFKKEQDILDVWFDSGISHDAVLERRPELQFPADLYLEGVDQYRGWYQSSLLTSLALHNAAPMKAIMSHGFTVDGKGQKMSKSLGNVIAPQQIIDQLGTDGLRLWVATIGNESDAVVSEILLRNVSEVYRKIRNTSRGLLMNLYDYDHARDAVPFARLLPIDKYALAQLYCLSEKVQLFYHDGDVSGVFHALGDFCATELSAFYLDIVKDRLYVEKANGELRRSAQTTLWHILNALTRLMAPILSFTAEYLSDYYQKDKAVSIHLQDFVQLPAVWHDSFNDEEWNFLKDVRSAVLKAIEVQREQGVVKHSLEARVIISLPRLYDLSFLKEFFIVSQIELEPDITSLEKTAVKDVYLKIERARGVKCPRCWHYTETPHEHGLCDRCSALVK